MQLRSLGHGALFNAVPVCCKCCQQCLIAGTVRVKTQLGSIRHCWKHGLAINTLGQRGTMLHGNTVPCPKEQSCIFWTDLYPWPGGIIFFFEKSPIYTHNEIKLLNIDTKFQLISMHNWLIIPINLYVYTLYIKYIILKYNNVYIWCLNKRPILLTYGQYTWSPKVLIS